MRNRLTPRQLGIALATLTAVISGVAVFVNGYGVRAWKGAGASAATYTTMKNLVAALILLAIAAFALRRAPVRIRQLPHTTKARLIVVGIIGGALPFVLFFEGLSRASSGQAAFIHKTLIVWVALLAVPFLGERLTALHLGAIGFLVAGQAMIYGLGDIGAGAGEAMILGATVLWSVEVIVAKRVLTDVPPVAVGVARMGIGAVALVAWTALQGGFTPLAAMSATNWGWVLVTGSILTAYVATWYLALSLAPAIDVTAVLVLGAVITAFLRTGIQGTALPAPVGVTLVAVGGLAAMATGLRTRAET